MGSSIRRDQCRQLVDEVSRLPSFPSVVGKVLATLDDPRSSTEDVARYIESDASLSAQLLRVANSAYYGLSGAVDTVAGALVVLGFNATRNLVLAATMLRLVQQSRSGLPQQRLFWQHTLEVALFSRALAQHVPTCNADALFSAGILHDVGCLLLEMSLGDRYLPVLRRALRDRIPLDVAEQSMLSVDHGDASGLLMERWGFPDSLRAACAFHHHPWNAPEAWQREACLVHLADQLSKRLHPSEHGYLPAHDILSWPHSKKVVGLDTLPDDQIVALAHEECAKASTLFHLFS